MSETWKFNGTKVNVPQITQGDAVHISGKCYLDDTFVENFTYLYYNDTAKYLEFGMAGFWNGSNNTYGSANILVLDTAPTGTLLTFLQTYATKQLTLKQSVEQHITDAYEAINNKSGTIPTQKNLANLAGAIDSISSGTDTSDATATAADILKDKTAYVATGKVTGTIETYNGETEEIPITGSKISGFIGLTNSSGVLTLTDDIANAPAYNTSASGTNVVVTSTLDNAYPFNLIAEETDDQGNVFITIPKMYISWVQTSDGILDGFKCSNEQVDSTYFIPDCFISPSGNGYVDKIYIGKYEGSGSSSKMFSKSGSNCLVSITRANARKAARAYGTSSNYYNGYQQLDMSMYVLYNMLCMMYYRTANIQKVYAGRTSGYDSTQATGSCDGISGKNGWNTLTGCVKMLGIENPYGNIFKWVDGIVFSNTNIYIHKLPTDFSDSTSGGVNLGFQRVSSSGYISKLRTGINTGTNSYVYASEISGSTATYYGDFTYFYSSGVVLSVGGHWYEGDVAGLWSLAADRPASDPYSLIGCRLCRRI